MVFSEEMLFIWEPKPGQRQEERRHRFEVSWPDQGRREAGQRAFFPTFPKDSRHWSRSLSVLQACICIFGPFPWFSCNDFPF